MLMTKDMENKVSKLESRAHDARRVADQDQSTADQSLMFADNLEAELADLIGELEHEKKQA